MRVAQLDGGAFTSPAGLWRSGEDMERRVRFPVPVYLIEVGEERILVDTGLILTRPRTPPGTMRAPSRSVSSLSSRRCRW